MFPNRIIKPLNHGTDRGVATDRQHRSAKLVVIAHKGLACARPMRVDRARSAFFRLLGAIPVPDFHQGRQQRYIGKLADEAAQLGQIVAPQIRMREEQFRPFLGALNQRCTLLR